jgi:flagellar motor switch protein FliM
VADLSPFPFDRLAHIPVSALGPLRAVARSSRAPAGWGAALDVLRTVLGTDVHVGVVDVRWVEPRAMPELPAALAALRVEVPSGVVVAELEPSAAVALVDVALGAEANDDPVAFRPLRAAELGVLAYLAARFVLAARPLGGRVLGWTTDPRALAVALRAEPHIAIRLDLVVAGRVLGGRLWLPARGAHLPAAQPDLLTFADLPVRVRLEVGAVELASSEVAALRAGDVVLLDEALARPESGDLRGHGRVRVVGARAPWFSVVIADSRSARIESLLTDKEMVPMGHNEKPAGPASLGPLAAEIPVEVVVELGRATLTVGTLSNLAPGEVIVLDRAPSDPVALTAGDRVLAHGELVVVEGQVGVRILDVARR